MPRIGPNNLVQAILATRHGLVPVEIKCRCGEVLVGRAMADKRLLPLIKSVDWHCDECLNK